MWLFWPLAGYTQGLEQRQQLEIRADRFQALAGLMDGPGNPGHLQVLDFGWIDAHNAAAGSVDSGHIAAGHQDSGRLRLTLNGTVALHPHDAVDQREAAWNDRVEVCDGFMNAGPVQYVLGPAVYTTGHQPEQVLHPQRRARPMMGFHFWQAH